ncbi:hypothetical protein BGX29_004462 [Mortierella sp. GBA35]|nr:hypothetical protein BGX29_004462 [Mortierella sp. GBA35]
MNFISGPMDPMDITSEISSRWRISTLSTSWTTFRNCHQGNTSQPSLQKSELITMVRENVEKNAEITAWRSTDEWKELAHGSVMGYAITIVPDEKEKDGES